MNWVDLVGDISGHGITAYHLYSKLKLKSRAMLPQIQRLHASCRNTNGMAV